MKKTLLLAASGPGILGVGGVLIRDTLQTDGLEQVSLAALLPLSGAGTLQRDLLSNVRVFEPPDEFYPDQSASAKGLAGNWLRRCRSYDPAIRRIAKDILAMIRQEQPGQLWIILNSMAVIDVLYLMLPELSIDLLPQVWDDPEHLCRQRRMDRFARARMTGRFRSILSRATRTAVICEAMASHYQNLMPGRYVVVRHGMSSFSSVPRHDASSSTEFRIGLSGSMYSPASWRALQRALDALQWKIDGRQVVLVVTGGKIEFTSQSTAECRFLGWRTPEESLRLMTECDGLYLPQAFEGAQRALTSLSFPTKLSAYAASGRPVFIHTPQHGSLVRFCHDHKAGWLCHSLEPGEIARELKRLEDPTFRKTQAESICRLGREVLSREKFERGIREFLGVGIGDTIQDAG